jgi:heptosyltransferase-2
LDIEALAKGWAHDLLEAFDWNVQAVPSGFWAAGRMLRKLSVRYGLLFPNSLSSAMAMWFGNIQAVGYRTDGRSFFLHQGLVVQRQGLHDVEYYWRLGEAAHALWGDKTVEWPTRPPERIELRLTDAHHWAAATALAEHRIETPYVVCCPMATGLSQGRPRIWPHFADLCSELLAAGHRVVACPGPNEHEACAKALPGATILPDLSLGAYAAVLQRSERVVANDSGPMHLAAAVGAPVLGVFGVTDPQRTRPWGGHFVGSAAGWPDLNTVLPAFDALPARSAADNSQHSWRHSLHVLSLAKHAAWSRALRERQYAQRAAYAAARRAPSRSAA